MIEKSIAGTESLRDLGRPGGRNLNWPVTDLRDRPSPADRRQCSVCRSTQRDAVAETAITVAVTSPSPPPRKPDCRQSIKARPSVASSSSVSICHRLRVGCEQVRLPKIFRCIDVEERIHGGDVPLDNGNAVIRGERIDFSGAIGQGLLQAGKN